MIKIKSYEIYNNLELIKIYNKIDVDLTKTVIDSREATLNSIYFGIKGENSDGNAYYMEAFKNGSSLAILENLDYNDKLANYLKENNKSIILVKDTILSLGKLASYKQSKFQNPVVAITGSAGKTSTKDLTYLVLNEKLQAYKTMGNKNNHLGLPLTVLNMQDNPDVMVLEMGMNHLKEISYLAHIVKPTVAIITNVGTAHIGNLGSRENILKAKLEIIETLDKNGTIIINNDNDLLHKWYLENKDKYQIKTFGIKETSDVMAKDIKLNNEDSSFNCLGKTFHIKAPGEHFIYNALASITAGLVFKLDLDTIAKGVAKFVPEKNRMNTIEKNGITFINDCYNANFDSLKFGLEALGRHKKRKIALLGTMGELGSYSEKLHADIGNIIVKENIDILITIGEYTNFINERALSLGFNPANSYHFKTKKEAINLINKIKQEKDIILIKASNAQKFNEIIDKII